MMLRRSARRAFLRGFGLGAFALPFLRTLEGRAQAPADARRLVVFTSAVAPIMSQFYPGAGNTYPRTIKPLEPLKRKIIVMRGINNEAAGKTPVPPDHDPDFPTLLVGRQSTGRTASDITGISVDQHIANTIGKKTKFPSLQLCVNVFSLYPCIASRGAGQGMPSERSPYVAFDRIFKDVSADPTALQAIHREKKSIIDIVREETSDLRSALGAEERCKLDAHLTSIRELETGLGAGPAVGTMTCKAPELGAPLSEKGAALIDNMPTLLKLQLDNVAMALACDLTRVITMQFSCGTSGLPFRWLGINFSHHGIAHGDFGTGAAQRSEWLLKIEEWTAAQYMYLLQKMDGVNDGEGTLLDNSAVLWTHEQSDGSTHSRKDMAFVLAGSCRGQFTTNRAVDFGGKSSNGLLISLANAMQVPTQQFGDPQFSKGPLAL